MHFTDAKGILTGSGGHFGMNIYAYELPSPNTDRLMSKLMSICRKNDLLCTPDACFEYMYDFPDKYEQMSIFDQIE